MAGHLASQPVTSAAHTRRGGPDRECLETRNSPSTLGPGKGGNSDHRSNDAQPWLLLLMWRHAKYPFGRMSETLRLGQNSPMPLSEEEPGPALRIHTGGKRCLCPLSQIRLGTKRPETRQLYPLCPPSFRLLHPSF